VGLVGLAAARLLETKCTGIYHTDFTRQVDMFIGDEGISMMVEAYTRGFFRLMDEIRVPTEQYIAMLEERGLEASRMKIFRRGIEPGFVVTDRERQDELRKQHGIPNGVTLLWAGRVGKEKNLDFLIDVYMDVSRTKGYVNLVLVGDGPELERLKQRTAGNVRVIFTGRVERSELPHYYGLADAFVFPSTTDTFGMVVLEAQACGLPCLVTNVGGPQEIVRHGQSGYVLPADRPRDWVDAIDELIERRDNDPDGYRQWQKSIRRTYRSDYSWDSVLDEMMGVAPSREAGKTLRVPADGARADLELAEA